MDILTELERRKESLLAQIAETAKQGGTGELMRSVRKLEKLESLTDHYNKLAVEIREFLQDKKPEDIHEMAKTPSDGKSSREQGKEARAALLTKLENEGIRLQHVKGAIYRTRSGKRVGIAFATERNPNRWFLGLPAEQIDHAVLLCQPEIGKIVEIYLPEAFFLQHGRNLSQSKGQLKFNVSRAGRDFIVQVPGTEGVNPSLYSTDLGFLK